MNTKKMLLFSLTALLLLEIVIAAGGGGGGGGGSSTSKFVFSNSRLERTGNLRSGRDYDLQMANREKFEFSVDDVGEDYIDVAFDSESTRIGRRETKYFDLNDNGKIDLSITFFQVQYGSLARVMLADLRDNRDLSAFEEVKVEEPEEYELKCDHLGKIRERVKCRFNLEENDFMEEAANSIHEECRAMQGDRKGRCIARYNAIAKCYDLPLGEQRFVCGRKELKLGKVIDEKNKCLALEGEEKTACMDELKEKVYNIVKFRFYDLEERAEDMLEEGADVDVVSEFVSFIAEKKIEFNAAKNIEEKRQIVLDVREGWKNFIKEVKNE